MRKFGRTDANHTQIVKTFREMGCSVQSLASIGGGCPDLMVGRCSKMVLVEVKDGAKSPSQRRLTPDEEQWHFKWKSEVHIITSVEEAIKLVNEQLA